jgi:hypothetical protein
LQYFFNFDLVKSEEKAKQSKFTEMIAAAGVVNATKLVAIPQGPMNILIRIENLDDFLSNTETTRTINVQKIAAAYWMEANGYEEPEKEFMVDIIEKSLTGNMKIEDMLKRKVQWKTVDDDILEESTLSRGEPFDAVKLEAQRIRVFDLFF